MPGAVGDKASVRLYLRIGIPGTYSSVEIGYEYEGSMLPEDGRDPQVLFRRVAAHVRAGLEREKTRVFKELGLADDATPANGKDRLKWRST